MVVNQPWAWQPRLVCVRPLALENFHATLLCMHKSSSPFSVCTIKSITSFQCETHRIPSMLSNIHKFPMNRIPTGFRNTAQGCVPRATLGFSAPLEPTL
jgi:hypothetical protein